MSLATFKKKSINSASSATKRSGKPTNEYWMYQGPYGRKGSLSSTIFKASLDNSAIYNGASNSGFSVTGPYRNIGQIGRNMKFSKSGTPYRGVYPKGWGGTNGRYPSGPNNVLLNITPVITGVAIQNSIVKPPVLSTKGMLARRYRWMHSGQYPNYWVQPNYTGNQTDSSSQGLYIHNKSVANDRYYDVNDTELYTDCYVRCGSTGCSKTPAKYVMTTQQSNAPYTKSLYQPKDASAYTLRVQFRCQNQTDKQKPYPYAVQTGTGILTGGTSVTNVGNACNTSSNITTSPPEWYTSTNSGGNTSSSSGGRTSC